MQMKAMNAAHGMTEVFVLVYVPSCEMCLRIESTTASTMHISILQ